jgi:hypothetical protein
MAKNNGTRLSLMWFHHSVTSILPLRAKNYAFHTWKKAVQDIKLDTSHTSQRARYVLISPTVSWPAYNRISASISIKGQSDSVFTIYICLDALSICTTWEEIILGHKGK